MVKVSARLLFLCIVIVFAMVTVAEALYCSQCGKELQEGAKYCSSCGSAAAQSGETTTELDEVLQGFDDNHKSLAEKVTQNQMTGITIRYNHTDKLSGTLSQVLFVTTFGVEFRIDGKRVAAQNISNVSGLERVVMLSPGTHILKWFRRDKGVLNDNSCKGSYRFTLKSGQMAEFNANASKYAQNCW